MYSAIFKSFGQVRIENNNASPGIFYRIKRSMKLLLSPAKSSIRVGDYVRFVKQDAACYQCDHRLCLKVIDIHHSETTQQTLVYCSWTEWNGEKLNRKTNWFPSRWLHVLDAKRSDL